MKMKLSREFYIPKNAVEVKAEDINAVAYLDTNKTGAPIAMIFIGKQSKPKHHYRFKSVERRDEFIQQTFKDLRETAKLKAQRKAEAKAKKDNMAAKVKVGDIFYSSWGYDQTNINFYLVLAKNNKKLTLIETGKDVTSEHEGYEYVTPNNQRWKGDEFTKMINSVGGLTMNTYEYAYLWDGKPKHQTAFGYGH